MSQEENTQTQQAEDRTQDTKSLRPLGADTDLALVHSRREDRYRRKGLQAGGCDGDMCRWEGISPGTAWDVVRSYRYC